MALIPAMTGYRPTPEPEAWRTRANCAQFAPEDFFPTGRQGRYREEVKDACRSCPVRDQCLQTALDSPWPPHGLWAGLSSREVERLWWSHHPNYRTYTHELGLPA